MIIRLKESNIYFLFNIIIDLKWHNLTLIDVFLRQYDGHIGVFIKVNCNQIVRQSASKFVHDISIKIQNILLRVNELGVRNFGFYRLCFNAFIVFKSLYCKIFVFVLSSFFFVPGLSYTWDHVFTSRLIPNFKFLNGQLIFRLSTLGYGDVLLKSDRVVFGQNK